MSNVEDFVKTLSGKPVLVFGLGRSGLSVLNTLEAAGATVVAGDDNEDNLKTLKAKTIDEADDDLADYAFLVLSPGIPFTHPEPHDIVKKAQEAGIEIICDIELYSRIYPYAKTIGITGTNGKSTTAALINHVLTECGTDTRLGGNIGTAIFDLDPPAENTWVVLEISSFQIDLCPTFRPDISVILNVTPDHIDRHGTIEHYASVKERLTEPNESSEYNTAVICTQDDFTKAMFTRSNKRKTIEAASDVVADLPETQTLTGPHNRQNMACAYEVAKTIGLEDDKIKIAIQSFPGLNHRQFPVRVINGVSYINDSKATNAASTAVALAAHDHIYWIVGGRKKQTGLDGLEEYFPAISHAFLIGETTDDFAEWFDKYGMAYTKSRTLEHAVESAHKMAQKNRGQPGGDGAVILSPACASFDQFASFEERGDYFAKLVEGLNE